MIHRAMAGCACVLLASTIAACGGGGGAASGGGIGGSGIVVGPIEELGSIVVDGIAFDTGQAEVSIDGVNADEAALALGMVVVVEGDVDPDAGTGVADFVRFERLLVGPIDGFDAERSFFALLGTRVIVDAGTVLDGIDLDSTIVGRTAEVSGLSDATGAVRATRVAVRSDGRSDLALFGSVRALDADAETFRLRALIVDYSGAEFTGGTASDLGDGTEVRIRFSARPVAGVVTAETVAVRPPAIGATGAPVVRASGFVTELLTRRVFVLDDRFAVRIDDDTEFVGGTRADVVVDARLALEGRARLDRIISARRVFVGGRDPDVTTVRD